MKKILLILGNILIGLSVFGQNPKTAAEIPKQQEMAALEDLVQRLGEKHEESIKAKNRIAILKKEEIVEEQQRMSKTLSPTEYDVWKAKQVKSVIKIEESK